jgi:hypothetical protein
MPIPAKGYYSNYDDIEIDISDLDTHEIEAVIHEARKRNLLPNNKDAIEEALSLLRRKDYHGVESVLTSLLPPERSIDEIKKEYEQWRSSRAARP